MENALILLPATMAALVHVYIFVMESLRITAPSTMKVFGIASREDAETIRPWAYNQGWYNLLLAIEVGVGAALLVRHRTAGVTLLVAGCGFMAMAALVLATSDRSKVRPAAIQGGFAALALLAVLFTR